ncbi:MAG: hypothetical protein ACX93N_09620, partial [Pseudohaliea sp.]
RKAAVTVCEGFDGAVAVLYRGRTLDYRLLAQGQPPAPLDDEKSVHLSVQNAKQQQLANPAHKPAPDHPWKRIPVKPGAAPSRG